MAWIRLVRAADGRLAATGTPCWSAGYRLADGGGIHAGWTFEAGAFSLCNDRYGLHPLFYAAADDACVVATSLPEVLAAGAPADWDDDALAVFVRIGFFLGADTPFRSIRAVPPAAVLEWSESGPRMSGSLAVPRPSALSRDEAIDAFLALFERAIAKRPVRGWFALPLSGGRDSRHILLALQRTGVPPAACATVTHFPPHGQSDCAIAAAICARLGLPHRIIPQSQPRLAAEREKNQRTSLCADEHAQFVALTDYLRAATDESYDGIGGDVLTQSSYLTADLHARFHSAEWLSAAEAILDAGGRAVSERALARLLAPPLLARLTRARALARIAEEARSYAGWPNPVGAFYFWNRTRREIALAPYALACPVVMLAPFLDVDVFDLLSALPAPMLVNGRFHDEAIARGYPALADMPYGEDAATRRTTWPGGRRLAAGLAATVWHQRQVLSWSGLAPSLAATLADGRPERLWYTALAAWLADTANCPARVSQFAAA